MFQSISEIFGTSSKTQNKEATDRSQSPTLSGNVNTARGGNKKSKSIKDTTPEQQAIESLQNELKIRDAALAALSAKCDRLEDEKRLNELESMVKRRHRPVATVAHMINDEGRSRVKMGTRGSVLTQNILEAISEPKKNQTQLIAEKFLNVFHDPVKYLTYLQSENFAKELIQVCQAVSESFEQQPRVVFLQSPVYVFGDIHGNLEDLHFFSDNLWKLGMDLAAGHYLFLGDYVDRGMSCLECVAYLFGLRLLYPHKITMLRGNHETRDVSRHYYLFVSLFTLNLRFFLGQRLGTALSGKIFSLPMQRSFRSSVRRDRLGRVQLGL
jgi:hypothetical protein